MAKIERYRIRGTDHIEIRIDGKVLCTSAGIFHIFHTHSHTVTVHEDGKVDIEEVGSNETEEVADSIQLQYKEANTAHRCN